MAERRPDSSLLHPLGYEPAQNGQTQHGPLLQLHVLAPLIFTASFESGIMATVVIITTIICSGPDKNSRAQKELSLFFFPSVEFFFFNSSGVELPFFIIYRHTI